MRSVTYEPVMKEERSPSETRAAKSTGYASESAAPSSEGGEAPSESIAPPSELHQCCKLALRSGIGNTRD